MLAAPILAIIVDFRDKVGLSLIIVYTSSTVVDHRSWKTAVGSNSAT